MASRRVCSMAQTPPRMANNSATTIRNWLRSDHSMTLLSMAPLSGRLPPAVASVRPGGFAPPDFAAMQLLDRFAQVGLRIDEELRRGDHPLAGGESGEDLDVAVPLRPHLHVAGREPPPAQRRHHQVALAGANQRHRRHHHGVVRGHRRETARWRTSPTAAGRRGWGPPAASRPCGSSPPPAARRSAPGRGRSRPGSSESSTSRLAPLAQPGELVLEHLHRQPQGGEIGDVEDLHPRADRHPLEARHPHHDDAAGGRGDGQGAGRLAALLEAPRSVGARCPRSPAACGPPRPGPRPGGAPPPAPPPGGVRRRGPTSSSCWVCTSSGE